MNIRKTFIVTFSLSTHSCSGNSKGLHPFTRIATPFHPKGVTLLPLWCSPFKDKVTTLDKDISILLQKSILFQILFITGITACTFLESKPTEIRNIFGE